MASYDNEIYLTFDTDWADEAVLRDTIDVLDARNVAATARISFSAGWGTTVWPAGWA